MPKPTATDQLRTTQSASEDRHNAVSGFRVKRLALAIALGAGLGIGLAACSPTTPELIGAGHRVEQEREDVRNNALHEGTGQPRLHTLAADFDVSTRPRAASPERARKPVQAANTTFPMQMYAQKTARDVHGKPGRIMPQPVDIVIASEDRERYASLDDNPLKLVSEQPVSTFSIDVDTGSYANVRRFLNRGQLPPGDAVRVEEMLNYFSYDYAQPDGRDTPFAVTTELAVTPWNPDTRLVQIGIKGYEVAVEEIPAANLVFLIDVSGSMRQPNKIGLLKSGLKMLARQLRPQDRISVVVYAGASGVALEPTPGDNFDAIAGALDKLRAGGSTNGAAAIQLAYAKARETFVKRGINRVLLATDGDFNVGTTDFDSLKRMVERERKSGVSLTTLGFGAGNYNSHLMEQLAHVGNGNYAYIDTAKEAHKVLVQQMAGTLATIAKDVKIQVEFNPLVVAEYRLIGYENRKLKREDFNNDRVDAGEIGAGHTVTALYEVALVGSQGRRVDPLRYGPPDAKSAHDGDGELAFLRMRYKQPGGSTSKLIERPIQSSATSDSPSARLSFAAAVAGFGQLLRGGQYLESFDYPDVLRLATRARGADPHGYRAEFLQLVSVADSLTSKAGDKLAKH